MMRAVLLTLLLGPGAARADDGRLVLIAHPEVPLVGPVGVPELRRLFLGTQTHWPKGGGRVVVLMLPPAAPATRALLAALDRSEVQWRTAWQALELSGQNVAPRHLPTGPELVLAVAGQAGAVGYAWTTDLPDPLPAVQVLEVAAKAAGKP